jgi:hypothetical protein
VFDQNCRDCVVVLTSVGTGDRPTSDSVEIAGNKFAAEKNDGNNAGAIQLGAAKRISLFRKYLNKRTSKVESAPPTHLKPYDASGESDGEVFRTSFEKGKSNGDAGGAELGPKVKSYGEADDDDSRSSSSSSIKRNARFRNAVIPPETDLVTSSRDSNGNPRCASSTRPKQASEKGHVHSAASSRNKDQLNDTSLPTHADRIISCGAVARNDSNSSVSSLQSSANASNSLGPLGGDSSTRTKQASEKSPVHSAASARNKSTRLKQGSEKSRVHSAASARDKDQLGDALLPTHANRIIGYGAIARNDSNPSGSSLQSSSNASNPCDHFGSPSSSSTNTLSLMRLADGAIKANSRLRKQGTRPESNDATERA